jgi:hypothetical protein
MEHAEHIEHAGHHGGSFGGIIAITMAVIAAMLAVVTMMSHRSHNETLLYHSDANRLQTQANVLHTRASDTWNFYQAKKIRSAESKSFLAMLPLFSKEGANADAVEAARKDWAGIVERYEGDGKDELKDLKARAEGITKEAESKTEQSILLLERSEETHAKSNRFDLGELGVEMGLVLCSIAVLTQSRKFWGAAIATAGLGVLMALSGWLGIGIEHVPEGGAHGGENAPAEAHGGKPSEAHGEKGGEKSEHDAAAK